MINSFSACSEIAANLLGGVGTWPDQGMAWLSRVVLSFVATIRSLIPTRSELGCISCNRSPHGRAKIVYCISDATKAPPTATTPPPAVITPHSSHQEIAVM
jgi:hypothetical protein